MRHLGVLGGTFDPIHQGHVTLAKYAIHHFDLDGVLFAPAFCPPHKDQVTASPEQRLKMCRLALADETQLMVTDADMRTGPSYTVELMKRLRKEYPDTVFSFIIGADKLPSLHRWRGADKLFKLCDFICCARADSPVKEETLAQLRTLGAKVYLLPDAPFPGASHVIRERIARLECPSEVHQDVLCYIAKNGLYQKDWVPKLRGMMNEHRFRHTLGVRKTAVDLARQYGASPLKAAAAALLHDCAKGMSGKELRKIAQENALTEDETILSSGALMHGLVGAYLARERFHVTDEEILDAIRYHTIGRAQMTVLDLIIFVADAIEPNREDYEGLEAQRKIVRTSLRAAALKSLYTTREYLLSQGKLFFEAGEVTIRSLEGQLTQEEKLLLEA